MNKMDRILVYGLEFIGDSLFTTPFLRELRGIFPHSYITVLTGTRGAATVLLNNPYVDKVVELKKDFKTRKDFIRAENFDKAFVLNTSLSAALETWRGRVKKIYGHRKEGRGILLSRSIRFNKKMHYADNHVSLLEKLYHITPKKSSLEIYPLKKDRESAAQILAHVQTPKSKGIVCLIPGTTNTGKAWSTENFSRLAGELVNRGWSCISIGSSKDVDLCSQIKGSVNLAGKTSVHELYGIFEKCAAIVSGDTGPLHIAGCVNTPHPPFISALYGPTDPRLYGVYQYRNIQITRKPSRDMSDISVDEILSAVLEKI